MRRFNKTAQRAVILVSLVVVSLALFAGAEASSQTAIVLMLAVLVALMLYTMLVG